MVNEILTIKYALWPREPMQNKEKRSAIRSLSAIPEETFAEA
jgi:hypothetical protein